MSHVSCTKPWKPWNVDNQGLFAVGLKLQIDAGNSLSAAAGVYYGERATYLHPSWIGWHDVCWSIRMPPKSAILVSQMVAFSHPHCRNHHRPPLSSSHQQICHTWSIFPEKKACRLEGLARLEGLIPGPKFLDFKPKQNPSYFRASVLKNYEKCHCFIDFLLPESILAPVLWPTQTHGAPLQQPRKPKGL